MLCICVKGLPSVRRRCRKGFFFQGAGWLTVQWSFVVTSWALAEDAELVWLKLEASAVGSELCSKLALEHKTPQKENKLK